MKSADRRREALALVRAPLSPPDHNWVVVWLGLVDSPTLVLPYGIGKTYLLIEPQTPMRCE